MGAWEGDCTAGEWEGWTGSITGRAHARQAQTDVRTVPLELATQTVSRAAREDDEGDEVDVGDA